MNNVIIKTEQSTRDRLIALLLTCPFLLFLGGYMIIAGAVTSKSPVLFLIPAFMVLLGCAIPIVEFRYRLVVTEKYVEQRYWRTTKLEFNEITEAEVLHRGLILTGASKRISVPGGIIDRDEVYRVILMRLKKEPGVVITGNKKRISSILNY